MQDLYKELISQISKDIANSVNDSMLKSYPWILNPQLDVLTPILLINESQNF